MARKRRIFYTAFTSWFESKIQFKVNSIYIGDWISDSLIANLLILQFKELHLKFASK